MVFMRFILISFVVVSGCGQSPAIDTPAVAHAGGGIDGKAYTNSFNALNLSYANGFELFEIDFNWTSDNQLVCLHDWNVTPKWLLNYHDEKPLTLVEFNQLRHPKLNMQPCNLQSLNQWLIEHPKAFIVTDIKDKNITGLELIKHSIDNAETRVIPQMYQPYEYQVINDMGYQSIIWTLYKYHEDSQTVVRKYKNMDLFAMTMPEFRAKQGLAPMLNDPPIPTYVHTINEASTASEYQNNYGISSVYTDFLTTDLLDPVVDDSNDQ